MTLHDEQNNRPSSTRKVSSGYFAALSFALRFTGRCDLFFSAKGTAGYKLVSEGVCIAFDDNSYLFATE